MFTRNELEKIHRETALDAVSEFIDEGYPEEVAEVAADIAQDEYDCDCDLDGFFDVTDYEAAAKQAVSLWEEEQKARHDYGNME